MMLEKANYRDRKQISGCQVLRVGGRGLTAKQPSKLFEVMEVLYILTVVVVISEGERERKSHL